MSVRHLWALLVIVFIGLVSQVSLGRTFKNAYISFDIQDNWRCNLEQTEWVCRAEDPQEAKEAVIILTAKEKGPTDSFPLYEAHLNSPMPLVLKNGATTQSRVVYKAQVQRINDQPWLDGLHTNSEVLGYHTRYLATIKDQIAILVTFSAHNRYYQKHSGNFMKTIQSLRVIASKDLLSRADMGPIRGANERIGLGGGQGMPGDLLAADDESSGGKKGPFGKEMILGLGLLILAALGYIYFKSRKK